jgi:hypothetical protein
MLTKLNATDANPAKAVISHFVVSRIGIHSGESVFSIATAPIFAVSANGIAYA